MNTFCVERCACFFTLSTAHCCGRTMLNRNAGLAYALCGYLCLLGAFSVQRCRGHLGTPGVATWITSLQSCLDELRALRINMVNEGSLTRKC
jgi:hypothetical protein